MALFVRPLPFTATADGLPTSPISNANIDEPSLIFRNGDSGSTVVIDLGPNPVEYDTIALIGHNYPQNLNFTFRGSPDGNAPRDFNESSNYLGNLPEGTSAKTIHRLSSVQTARYIDIIITNSTEPHIEFQRIVIGKALEFGELGGIDTSAEQSFFDQSVQYVGSGWSNFDEFDVLPQWKVGVSFIDQDVFSNQWFSFLNQVGKKRAFLFVPQTFDETRWQSEAIFGRIVNTATSNVQGHDLRRCELVIRALAP